MESGKLNLINIYAGIFRATPHNQPLSSSYHITAAFIWYFIMYSTALSRLFRYKGIFFAVYVTSCTYQSDTLTTMISHWLTLLP